MERRERGEGWLEREWGSWGRRVASRLVVWGVLCCLLLCGGISSCTPLKLVRVVRPEGGSGPPVIERLIDLGGLPLPRVGEIGGKHTDGRLTPGEWVAIVGRNLSHQPRLLLNGAPWAVGGYLRGGALLARVPRELSPWKRQQLQVITPAGTTSFSFSVVRYVVAADTAGDRIQFLPVTSLEKKALKKKRLTSLAFRRAKIHTFSPGGSLLYVLQAPRKGERLAEGGRRVRFGVKVIHLGAKGSPQEAGHFQAQLSSFPRALAAVDETTLLILGERELVQLRVWPLERVRVLARYRMPALAPKTKRTKRAWVDLALLPGQKKVALLEAYHNRLTVLSLALPLKPVASIQLARQVGLPLSMDLASDPDDPLALWVLQGPNLRLAGKKIGQTWKRIVKKIKGIYAPVRSKRGSRPGPSPRRRKGAAKKKAAPGESPKGQPPEGGGARERKETREGEGREGREGPKGQAPEGGGSQGGTSVGVPCRLVRVRLQGRKLVLTGERPLPTNFFPFYLLARRKGKIFVSGANGRVFDFSGVAPSLAGLKQILAVLKGSFQLGRILQIGPAGTKPRTVIQGVALYFNMDAFPDGTLLYTAVRLGYRVLPPSLAVDWGVEIERRAFLRLRRLEWRSLLPPYTFSLFSLQ